MWDPCASSGVKEFRRPCLAVGDVGTASLMVLTTWKHCPKWHLQLLLLESQNKEETFTGLPRGEGTFTMYHKQIPMYSMPHKSVIIYTHTHMCVHKFAPLAAQYI